MTDTRVWANPEKTVRAALISAAGLAGDEVGTSTPGDLELRPKYVRLTVVRGWDDRLTDRATVDVEVFTNSGRSAAGDEAERLRQVMHQLAGRSVEVNHLGSPVRVLFDSVSTVARPSWRDYRNPKIYRYVATYEVRARPVYTSQVE